MTRPDHGDLHPLCAEPAPSTGPALVVLQHPTEATA